MTGWSTFITLSGHPSQRDVKSIQVQESLAVRSCLDSALPTGIAAATTYLAGRHVDVLLGQEFKKRMKTNFAHGGYDRVPATR